MLCALRWKDVLEGPRTHSGWADVYRNFGPENGGVGTSYGTEFRRWETTYPVPENLRRLRSAS